MTCPISCPISCSCQCADVEPTPSRHTSSHSAISTHPHTPITSQPQSTHNIRTRESGVQGGAGDYTNPAHTPIQSIFDTIRGAGSLVSDLINSDLSQRSFRSCRDYCDEYCCFSTPDWLKCMFGCCCDSLIAEDSQESREPNVMVQMIQNYREMFGPVVLGLAIGYSGLNIADRIANNMVLTSEEEQRLLRACHHAQEMYSSLIVHSLRAPLVQAAEEIQLDSDEVKNLSPYVCEGLKRTLLGMPAPKQVAKYMIVLSNVDPLVTSSPSSGTATPENTTDDATDGFSVLSLALGESQDNSKVATTRSLNWYKLYQQLKKLLVCDLTSDDTFPLGSQARAVLATLKHTLNLMSQGDDALSHPGFGYFIQAPLFLC